MKPSYAYRLKTANDKKAADRNEANRVLNSLAGYWGSEASVDKSVAREIMEITGGTTFSQGCLMDIKLKSLGLGIYRVTLKERNGAAK